MLVDTHVHFPEDSVQARVWMARAQAAGVDWMLAVGGSPTLNRGALSAARRWPQVVSLALGWDRSQATIMASAPADKLDRLFENPLAAVGEIGLDYHYDHASAAAQRSLLARQMVAAFRRDLPVVAHCRDAESDFLAILDATLDAMPAPSRGPGVLHCFTGDSAFAQKLLDRGLYISFSGILTFRNADTLRAVAAAIPAERILVETDAPYLAPEPHRGKPNEPAQVAVVARALAAVRGTDPVILAEQIKANARRLFGDVRFPCQTSPH